MDKSLQAIKRQTKAMNCDPYIIGIRDAASGKMMNKQYNLEELFNAYKYLKAMNQKNNDIYIKPDPNNKSNLILIDDVDELIIDEMRNNGHEPACIIETSYKNLQAWIKVPCFDNNIKRQIARYLAIEYDADINSATTDHFGRLSGFTNRKPEYLTALGFPWVLCRFSKGIESSEGQNLVELAQKQLKTLKQQSQDIRKELNKLPENTNDNNGVNLINAYKSIFNYLKSEYKDSFDANRADFAFARQSFERKYNFDDIYNALYNCSYVTDRKKAHVNNYVVRTVAKAYLWLQYQQKGYNYIDVKDKLLDEAKSLIASMGYTLKTDNQIIKTDESKSPR